MRRILALCAAGVVLAGCGSNIAGDDPPAGGATSPKAAVRAFYDSVSRPTSGTLLPQVIAEPDDRLCPSRVLSGSSNGLITLAQTDDTRIEYVEQVHRGYSEVTVQVLSSAGSVVTESGPYPVVEHGGRYFVC